ncbi:unnamed protein product [Agarophyton chilense]|eukprot:gb/GEZJ01002687.1/.p1 GENE.gb/GEZJ01002687.1/~~gb/GEZJ01002687.1/.p1  ORF type:complete len:343 (-),score=57.68 gb/GEZJ01002687.1/:107-1135(-)
MALQGEGDPRWVVRQREDGRNVNGWHWEDKDVSAWAQQRIKQLLSASECSVGRGEDGVGVQSVDTVEGDATLYNRKGVLKVLYDLKVSGKWGTLCEGEDEDRAHGNFKFELFDEDPEILATLDAKAKKDSDAKKKFMQHVGPIIQQQCRIFIAEMHAGAGQAVDGLRKASKKKEDDVKVSDFLHTGTYQQKTKTKTTGAGRVKGDVDSVVMKDTFRCSAMDMYLALTDKRRLEAITRCRAVSEATAGGRVQLMNGEVNGRYERLEEAKQVVMEWKLRSWGDEAEAGMATISMTEEEQGLTDVEVIVSGVPKAMKSKTEGFWRVQVLQAMKVVMGWGSATQFL